MSNLPIGWTTIDLGECADWYSGGTPDTSNPAFWNGNIPWITASSLHNFYLNYSERQLTKSGLENGSRLMPENTIIFVVRGMSLKTEFRLGITRKPVAFGQDCKALIAKSGIDPWYLAYAIKSKSNDILGMVDEAGHGTGRLQTEVLKQIKIPIPPLHEQKRISLSIRLLDDKIELNHIMNRTLESMARSVFWEMMNDEDGRVNGWDEKRLGDICEFAYGKPLKAEERNEGVFPVYGSNGQVGWHNEYLVKGPGIVVGRKGNPGIVTWTQEDFFPIDTTFYVVPKEIETSLYWLYYTLISLNLPDLGADSAVPGLNRNIAYMSDVNYPPHDLMKKYDEFAKPLFDKINGNEREARTLGSLRDSLLPKLMRGEVRVKDVEK